jgi:DNA replication and repair protein RecF
MLIKGLSVSNFRNFESLEVSFAPGVNVLFGDNGSGKTNLLEAIFTLCLGRSQRGAADATLLRNDEEVWRLVGRVAQNGFAQELAVAYQRGGRRRITIDGVPAKLSELYETYCVVSAGPEDSGILSGAPSVRRTFIDIYLSQFSRSYLAELTDYHRALTQKNAALKSGMDASAFDAVMTVYGAKVMRARAQFIEAMNSLAGEYYGRIASMELFTVRYEPSVDIEDSAGDTSSIAQAFERKIAQYHERESRAGMALVGPHRDELAIEIRGLPARTHGSQGQWRTAAIALKLAVYDLLRHKLETTPLLLLDEIFAELDSSRALALIAAFGGYDQLFLTTAVEPPEPLTRNSRRLKIASGKIEEVL